MRTPAFPALPIAFHVASAIGFVGAAALLLAESRGLAPRAANADLAFAVAASALAVLSARAAVAHLRLGRVSPLRVRATLGRYGLVLLAIGLMGAAAIRFGGSGRSAPVAFCAGAGLWLLAIGFHLLPGLAIAPHGLVDSLGRQTPFERLEWFLLDEGPGEDRRVVLATGAGRRILLRARLDAADVAGLRARLREAGLAPLQ